MVDSQQTQNKCEPQHVHVYAKKEEMHESHTNTAIKEKSTTPDKHVENMNDWQPNGLVHESRIKLATDNCIFSASTTAGSQLIANYVPPPHSVEATVRSAGHVRNQ